MSYKIGLMLSMIFVAMFFALGVDLMSIQYVYSDLDTKSVSISYLIAQHGTIDDSLISSIESKYNIQFTCLSNCHPLFGDVVDYQISKEITTLVVSHNVLTVSIYRSAVIGYFG